MHPRTTTTHSYQYYQPYTVLPVVTRLTFIKIYQKQQPTLASGCSGLGVLFKNDWMLNNALNPAKPGIRHLPLCQPSSFPVIFCTPPARRSSTIVGAHSHVFL